MKNNAMKEGEKEKEKLEKQRRESEKLEDRVRRSSLAQMVGVGCQGNIEQAEQ